MDKKFFMMAAAAAMFAACSNDADPTQGAAEIAKQTPQVAQEVPVTFGAYVNRSTTRAGVGGEITTTSIQSGGAHATEGFGVFGYHTDDADYTQYAIPNFMYNQQVTHDGTYWNYEPVKYWPNEYESAMSDEIDKLTFFAYAPYVQVNPANGIPNVPGVNTEYNITQLTKYNATGDPFIKYVVDMDPATSVDLLWGVVANTTDYTDVSGSTTPLVSVGYPFLDLVKPTLTSKINFDFKHALAKLNVQIDAYVDGTNNSTDIGTKPDGTVENGGTTKTKIYVRSVTFSGFAMKGALNLNNSEANVPLWYDYSLMKELAGSDSEVTFYDGRKDGKEGRTNAAQKTEKPANLNPAVIQLDTPTAGVTKTASNLFNAPTLATPVYVIPTSGEMNVTIVYDVETEDPNLPTLLSDGITHGSSIQNKIYKENVFGGTGTAASGIDAGKAYTLKLHLGINSVTFDASVSAWDATATNVDTNLPENK